MPQEKLGYVAMDRRNEEKLKALEEIIEPLQEWINEFGCPHDILIIQQGNVQLYSGEFSFKLKIRD